MSSASHQTDTFTETASGPHQKAHPVHILPLSHSTTPRSVKAFSQRKSFRTSSMHPFCAYPVIIIFHETIYFRHLLKELKSWIHQPILSISCNHGIMRLHFTRIFCQTLGFNPLYCHIWDTSATALYTDITLKPTSIIETKEKYQDISSLCSEIIAI